MAAAQLSNPSISRGFASNRQRVANRGIRSLLFVSLLIHVGAVGGTIYAGSFRSIVPADMEAMPVELVTLGKPRNQDLLPRKATQPPPAPSTEAGVALEGVKTTKASKKEPQRRAKSKRRLSSTARKLLEGRDEDLDRVLQKLETPEGSEDGSPFGTTTNRAEAANAYEAQVATILRSRYQLPTTIPPSQRRFLEAEIMLYINRSGSITRYEYTKKHSNKAFIGALENLLRSVKLPPPPKVLAVEYATSGLLVRFKPD